MVNINRYNPHTQNGGNMRTKHVKFPVCLKFSAALLTNN